MLVGYKTAHFYILVSGLGELCCITHTTAWSDVPKLVSFIIVYPIKTSRYFLTAIVTGLMKEPVEFS